MTDKVLTTGQAQLAITKFKSIIDGGLVAQIEALNREGQILSQPNVWDGNLAVKFRGDWVQTHSDLKKVTEQLSLLQNQLKTINDNIMRAGGN